MLYGAFHCPALIGKAIWTGSRDVRPACSVAEIVRIPHRPPLQYVHHADVRCNLERPPRAASGWYRSLQSLPRSRVLFNVWPQVLTSFVGSTIVVAIHVLLQRVLGEENIMPPLSPTPHTFLATALGLMLVFRTNAAYDRFWEGRKIWGGVVNTGRNLARLVSYNMSPSRARACAVLIVCYAHSLAQRLQLARAEEPCRSLLWEISEPLAERITKATNKPLECLLALGELVHESFKENERNDVGQRGNIIAARSALETCIAELTEHMGACERICSTPVPLSYSRHTTRLLSLFLITLPLVLVDQPGGTIYTVPSVVFVTWALSGIDEVAHLIEDPFLGLSVSLPLDQICLKIQNDVLEQVTHPVQENIK